MTLTHFAIIAVCAYLFGSLSFAIIVSKVTLGKDIRNYGSGNAGLTNAYRTMGAKKTLFVLLGDIAKGAAAVSVGWALGGPVGKLTAGIFVILGHMFPLYFGFKGGKGIAATAGLILAIHPAFIPMGVILFFGTFLLTHYVSLGSLLVYAGFLIEMVIMGQMDLFSMPVGHRIEMYGIAAFLTAMAYWKHRENIKRLLSGTERKTYLFKKNKEALNQETKQI